MDGNKTIFRYPISNQFCSLAVDKRAVDTMAVDPAVDNDRIPVSYYSIVFLYFEFRYTYSSGKKMRYSLFITDFIHMPQADFFLHTITPVCCAVYDVLYI